VGSVTQLRPGAGGLSLGAAAAAYLATLDHPETAGTHRVYARPLGELSRQFGQDADVASLDPHAVAEWFTGRWGDLAPSTWNTARTALASAGNYWTEQGWVSISPASLLRRRKTPPDRDRALSRGEVEELLTRPDVALRERLLWRLLYESAARSDEVLSLDVPDLDRPNRSARVRRKGGAMDIIVWQTATARLLPRYLGDRTDGPLFVTERRARIELPPGDLDSRGRARLSYDQAEAIFKAASGGKTLHQLRHSALTHAAEDGVNTPMLKARSGHASVRSLAKYARVSAEALRAHQAATDPARRRK
jgi:integrase/recombinase XerC/integrase/recombinase XerD